MNYRQYKINSISSMILTAGILMLASSCNKKDDPEPGGNNTPGNHPAITLECDYFEQDRILTNDPEAPVDYIITCEAQVNAKLTVAPGVVIAFEENASLVINDDATLKMEGTADKPIILTGTQKEKGMWRGMLITSQKPSNSMKYVTIEYAGSKSTSHIGWPEAGLQIYDDARINIDHCTFKNNKGNGIYCSNKDGANATITNSVMTKNDYPMMVGGGFNSIELFNGTNSYAGNVNDYAWIQYGGVNADATWKNIDVPYFIETRLSNRFDVTNDANLTIEPGTEIMFSTDTKLRIIGGASLTMTGTPSEKIILRGKDDVAGAWNCVYVESSSVLNEIGHVEIINAGQPTGYPNGAVKITAHAILNIHDVTFTDCFEYAISLSSAGDRDFILTYDNLSLNNTPKMFSDWEGNEVIDPDSY